MKALHTVYVTLRVGIAVRSRSPERAAKLAQQLLDAAETVLYENNGHQIAGVRTQREGPVRVEREDEHPFRLLDEEEPGVLCQGPRDYSTDARGWPVRRASDDPGRWKRP